VRYPEGSTCTTIGFQRCAEIDSAKLLWARETIRSKPKTLRPISRTVRFGSSTGKDNPRLIPYPSQPRRKNEPARYSLFLSNETQNAGLVQRADKRRRYRALAWSNSLLQPTFEKCSAHLAALIVYVSPRHADGATQSMKRRVNHREKSRPDDPSAARRNG